MFQSNGTVSKTAAIFLSLTLTVFGSLSVKANELEAEMIAAQPAAITSLPLFTSKAHDIFGLPQKETFIVPPQIEMPRLESHLTNFIVHPEQIVQHNNIPELTGLVTSTFGYRKHPVKGKVRHHNGIDIAAKLGNPVLAPADGVVIFSGVKNGYGNAVEIDHGNGYVSLLAHHSRLLVKAGDIVTKATHIALAGRTGIATGVHVHVELRKDGKLINPIGYIVP